MYNDVQRLGPQKPPQIPPGAGGVLRSFSYSGLNGNSEFANAYNTSIQARFQPDTLAKSVRNSWTQPFDHILTPQRPSAMTTLGSDMFGPPTFSGTKRNVLYDLRGEAAIRPVGMSMPEGASDVGWRSYKMNMPKSTQRCTVCGPAYSSPVAQSGFRHNTTRDLMSEKRHRVSNISAKSFI